MPLLILLLILIKTPVDAQPLYTKLRAGFTLEGMGLAPVAMVSGEIPFLYRKKGFWNMQTGVGLTGDWRVLSLSAAGAITYNFLLNPYRRSLCRPEPGYSKFETYLELGSGFTVLDPEYGGLPGKLNEHKEGYEDHFAPSGLLGLRFHFVRERWIYLFKLRMTPFLDRRFVPWGGFQIGLGWR